MTCNLYRVLPNSRAAHVHGNYLVYRHCFDTELTGIALFDAAMWHKTAMFVTQSEAEHYCAYRNRLCEARGTDALPDDPGYKDGEHDNRD